MKAKSITILLLLFIFLLTGCIDNTAEVQPEIDEENTIDTKNGNNNYNGKIEFEVGYKNLQIMKNYFGKFVNRFDNFEYEKYENPREVSLISDGGYYDYDCYIANTIEDMEKIFVIKDEFLSKYTSSFFNTNSLIVCYFGMSNSGNDITITSIKRDNSELKIDLTLHEGYLETVSEGFIILETKKVLLGVKTITMDSKRVMGQSDTKIEHNEGYKDINILDDYFCKAINNTSYDNHYEIVFDSDDRYYYDRQALLINSIEEISILFCDKEELLKKYDENFFLNKSILIIYLEMKTSIRDISVISVQLVDKSLKVFFCPYVIKDIQDQVYKGITFVEMPKERIENIKTIQFESVVLGVISDEN